MDEEKIFTKYNPDWINKFNKEKENIINNLSDQIIIDIQHIGSTSIPDLSAKPIIDIGILVRDISDVNNFTNNLKNIGYEYKPDMSSVERIFLRKGNPINYHLSITSLEYGFWNRNIVFRDYLRKHKEYVKEYEKLKKKNLTQTPNTDFSDLSRSKIYNQGKGDFVIKILELAKDGI